MTPCNCDGAKTKLKPIIIQRIERTASPVNVCIITEIEFLLLIRPDSKKPKAGIISMTKPVEISIHEVSPALIDILPNKKKVFKKYITYLVSSIMSLSAYILYLWRRASTRCRKFYDAPLDIVTRVE